MSWGGLYYGLKSAWENMPRDDRLRARGFGTTYSGDNGLQWVPPDSYSMLQSNMMNDNNDAGAWEKFLDAASAWDPRDFERMYRVLPLDDPFSGNGTYTDARIASQGHGSLVDFLNFVSGGQGGQIVIDPQIGRVWVPNNKDAFDPYRDFSKSGDFVTRFMDGGGAIYLLAGGIASMSGILSVLGDFLPSSSVTDIPYDVGANLVNNPQVFTPPPGGPVGVIDIMSDVPYDVGQNLVNNPDVFKPPSVLDTLQNVPRPSIGSDPVTGDPVPSSPAPTSGTPPPSTTTPVSTPPATIGGTPISPSIIKLLPQLVGSATALARLFGNSGVTPSGLTPAQFAQLTPAQQNAMLYPQSTQPQNSMLPLLAIAGLAAFALN